MQKAILSAIAALMLSASGLFGQITEAGPKTYPTGTTTVPASGSTTTITTSGNVTVPSGATVNYNATSAINLEPGFHAASGVLFHAQIVALSPPVISGNLNVTASVGNSFSYQITASNAPSSYAETGLPDGLALNQASGLISGTPTTSGSSSVAITATNSTGSGNATLTITTTMGAPVITSDTSVVVAFGTSFSYQIKATNSPTRYLASNLPAGLTFDAPSATISGTATAAGPFAIALSATNDSGTGTAQLNLTVNPPPPVISSSTIVPANIGSVFTYAIVASNSPTSYAADSLPSWLSLNTTTGVLSGTPTGTGTVVIPIYAKNGGGTGSANLEIQIAGAVPIVSATTPAPLVLGSNTNLSNWNYTISASGTPTSFGASGLPPGMTVSATTGAITGTPTAAGTYLVTLSASNSNGTGTASVSFTVQQGNDNAVFNFADLPPTIKPTAGRQWFRVNIKNTGTTTWNTGYTVWADPGSPNSPTMSGIPTDVPPGTTIDVVFALTPPTTDNTNYNYVFSITNPAGVSFGNTLTQTMQVSSWLTPPYSVTSSTYVISNGIGQPTTYQIATDSAPGSYSANWVTQLAGYSQFNPTTGVLTVIPFDRLNQSFDVSGTQENGSLECDRAFVQFNSGGANMTPPPVLIDGVINTSIGWYSTCLVSGPAAYTFTGTPPSGIQWDDARRRFYGTPTQSGTFACQLTAKSLTGTVTVPVTFSIAATTTAPSAPGPLVADTITSSTVHLSWGPSTAGAGTSVAYYITYVDGASVDVSPSTSTSGTIGNYQPGSTHTFAIQAEDNESPAQYSPLSNTVTVTFLSSAPTITTQPTSQNVALGSAAQFTVAATGTNLSYQWQKNGTNISGATTSSLSFVAVQSSDVAGYSVVVTNAGGSVTSQTAYLAVSGPPTITTQPQSQTVAAGANVVFSVQVSGVGSLTYQWQKGGVDIAAATSTSLTLNNVGGSDAATYQCKVSNSAGTTVSNGAVLTVTGVGPSITTQPLSQTVTARSNVTFSVGTSATQVTFKWQRLPAGSSTFEDIVEGGTYSGTTTGSLTVNTVTSAMSNDEFRCVLTDTSGSSASNPATLTVIAAPTISSQPQSVKVVALTNATFSIAAKGPGLSYQWQRNGGGSIGFINITDNGTYSGTATNSLTITNVTGTMSGDQFRCVVTNTAGSLSSALATLSVSKIAPTITWANPAAINSGTALSSTQLNATASVPGAFVYLPAAGVVLSPGYNALSATFSPADTTNYCAIVVSVPITVNDVDSNGDGLPDSWGSNASAPSGDTLSDGTAISMIDEYNLWRSTSIPYNSWSGTRNAVPVVISMMASGSGTATVTINSAALGSRSFPFHFTPITGQTWLTPDQLYTVNSTTYGAAGLVQVPLGESYQVTVSTDNTITDYYVTASTESEPARVLHAAVEFNVPGVTGSTWAAFNSLRKSDLNGGPVSMRAVPQDQVPFASLDTSRLESNRIVTFGLGGNRSGESAGRIVYYAFNYLLTGGSFGFDIIKGPAMGQTNESATHFQAQLPAGYVDVVRTRAVTTVKYFDAAQSGYTVVNGFWDFGTATPVATYSLAGHMGNMAIIKGGSLTNAGDSNETSGAGTLTRSIGGVTSILEFATDWKCAIDRAQSGPSDNPNYPTMYTKHEKVDATLSLWNWRSVGQPRGALNHIEVTSGITMTSYDDTNWSYQSWDGPKMFITRYLGADTTAAIGASEEDDYNSNDTNLLGSKSILRGIGTDNYRELADQVESSNLQVAPVLETNSYGGQKYSEFLSLGHVGYGDNLGAGSTRQPLIALGELKQIRRTFGDGALDYKATGSTDLVTNYSYSTNVYDGKPAITDELTMMGNATVEHSSFTYDDSGSFAPDSTAPTTYPVIQKTISNYASSSTALTTITKYYSQRIANLDLRGKMLSVRRPDNTQTSYSYQTGNLTGSTWTASSGGTDLRVAELVGATSASPNVNSYFGAAVDPLAMDANRSTVSDHIFDAKGQLICESTYVYTGTSSSPFQQVNAIYYSYDDFGHVTSKTDASGRVLYSASYTGLRKTSETDAQGITLEYTYDDYDRVSTVTRDSATSAAVPGGYEGTTIGASVTTYGYDPLGRLTSEVVTPSGGGEMLVTYHQYDTAGRLVATVAPGGLTAGDVASGLTTSVAYKVNATDQSVTEVTTTLPSGGQKKEDRYKDGRVSAVWGTAVPDVATTYTYDATTGNMKVVETVKRQGSTDAGAVTTTVKDWIDRTLTVATGTFSGGTRTVVNNYNTLGQLKSQDTRSGDATGTIIAPTHLYQYDSFGRLSEEALDVNGNGAIDEASDYGVTKHDVQFQVGDGSSGADKTNWYRHEIVQDFAYEGTNASTARTESEKFDQVTGLSSTQLSHVLSLDADANVTESTAVVDTSAKTTTTTTSTTGSNEPLVQMTLNGLLVMSTNAQGQMTERTYDAFGRLEAVKDPRIGWTDYAYWPGTAQVYLELAPDFKTTTMYYDSAGRVSTKYDPVENVAYLRYDVAGNLTNQWGDTVNPVWNEYDDQNRRTAMHTYRSLTVTGSDWPTNAGNGDVTTWTFDGATGLLKSKADNSNATTTYDYTELGQIKTRTDARNWVTTYSYFGIDHNNLLQTVSYDGSAVTDDSKNVTMVPIGYTYYRNGKVKTVTDATCGTGESRSFTYYDGTTSSTNAQLNVSMRLASETLPASFYGTRSITYTYNYGATGLANGTISSAALPASDSYSVGYGYDSTLRLNSVAYNSGTAFNYGYETNSNLVSTVKVGTSAYREFDYEGDLSTDVVKSNRLVRLSQSWGGISPYEARMTYDAVGLRSTEKVQASAYLTALGRAADPGIDTDYSYSSRYEVTSSGKYVLNSDWSVGNSRSTTARGYAYDLMGNRGSDYDDSRSTNKAGTYTANALNQYSSTPASSAPSYDVNGNMTSDGTLSYRYDAENRLVRVSGTNVWTYKYDYLGRRVEKSSGTIVKRFLYDGWNLIAELDSTTIKRKYVWGLDASGSLSGGGGVGGLLEIDDTASGQFYPFYDSSFNVAGLYDSTGAIAAAYEYDPFGNIESAQGTYAAKNPFRSATKYGDYALDPTTGADIDTHLVYYGYRFYHPILGRFINRDPIGEQGGLNLYAFCGNDGVDRYDVLGNADQQQQRAEEDAERRKEEQQAGQKAEDEERAKRRREDPTGDALGRYDKDYADAREGGALGKKFDHDNNKSTNGTETGQVGSGKADEIGGHETPKPTSAKPTAPNSGVNGFSVDGSVRGSGTAWTYGGIRSLALKNGSTAGQNFIKALEGSGVWIYGFNSIRVKETLKAGLVWKDTGTAEHWVWTGSSLKGFEPTMMSQLPYLASLKPGVFINNSLTDVQAVETVFHEFFHYTNPGASEPDVRLATTQFLIDIGMRESQIPGAITSSGQVNAAVVTASAPPYTTAISRSGSLSDNLIGLVGVLPGGNP